MWEPFSGVCAIRRLSATIRHSLRAEVVQFREDPELVTSTLDVSLPTIVWGCQQSRLCHHVTAFATIFELRASAVGCSGRVSVAQRYEVKNSRNTGSRRSGRVQRA